MSIFDTKKHNFNEVDNFCSIDDIMENSPSDFFKKNWGSYLIGLSQDYDLSNDDLKQLVDVAYDGFRSIGYILGFKPDNEIGKDCILPTHKFQSDLKIDEEDFCILYGEIEDRNKPNISKLLLKDEPVSELISYLCDEKLNY